jgi:protein subunit release factor B
MNNNKKDLLFSVTKKDFDIAWFSGTGAGGQYRNKHQNCCRMVHKESGVTATGQSQRSREANLREAFTNIVHNPRFTFWLQQRAFLKLGEETLEQKVEKEMIDKNLKVEYTTDHGWEVVS